MLSTSSTTVKSFNDSIYEKNFSRQLSQEMFGLEQAKEKAMSEASESNSFIKSYLKDATRIVEGLTAKKGKKVASVKLIESLQAEEIAFYGLTTLIDAALTGGSTSSTSSVIGKSCIESIRLNELKQTSKTDYNNFIRRLNKTPGPKKAAFVKTTLEAKSELGDISQEVIWKLGLLITESFIQELGLFIAEEILNLGKSTVIIKPTAKLRADFEKHGEYSYTPYLKRLPMVCPPVDHELNSAGGYILNDSNNLYLLKGYKNNAPIGINNLESINILQQTPYVINKEVADVYKACVKAGLSIKGIGSTVEIAHPEKPWSPDLTNEQVTEWINEHRDTPLYKNWAKAASDVYSKNTKNLALAKNAVDRLDLMEQLIDEEALYFPKFVDFRGRLYDDATSNYIAPQAPDAGKALLKFALGKPLGESGGFWLCVHLANVMGFDKIPYDHRVIAVMTRKDEIISWTKAPLKNTGWMDADKPWQTLAAAYEFAGFMRDGDEYVSHLPIAMDGSCSGLQHYAGLLHCENSAAAVNVSPSERPEDVYTRVKDRVMELLDNSPSPIAQEWKPVLSRAIVKQPVMTTPYGVTKLGVHDQVRKAIADNELQFKCGTKDAAGFLAPLISQAIGDVVSAAEGAMTFLRELAKCYAKEGRQFQWMTPSGFHVRADYRKAQGKQLAVLYKGNRRRLSFNVKTDKVNAGKIASAAAPNVVHSLDAAHLSMTTRDAYGLGVDCFSMIHDSFGTHAADTETLYSSIRDKFQELYDRDFLQELLDAVPKSIPRENLPTKPQLGNLDLAQIAESQYIFA